MEGISIGNEKMSAFPHYRLIIIHECSKKLLMMKNSKSFFNTLYVYLLFPYKTNKT